MRYPVPRAVQMEATQGLAWRRQYKRGGTKVGAATARWLASGIPVTEAKLRHIHRYFPRHAWERRLWWRKEAPSNGRIAWALWGGDAAWAWTKKMLRQKQ